MRANSRSVSGGVREGGIVGRYRSSEMVQQASYGYRYEAARMPAVERARRGPRDGTYEFSFCSQLLVITGATGSPINPQAIK
jgi:hypothetical protein